MIKSVQMAGLRLQVAGTDSESDYKSQVTSFNVSAEPSPEAQKQARVKLRRGILEVDMEDPVFGHSSFVSARTFPRELLAVVLKGDEDRVKEVFMDSRMPLDAATTQYSHADTRTPIMEAFASGDPSLIMSVFKWRKEHIMVGINEDVFEPLYRENPESAQPDDYSELTKYAAPERLREPLLTLLVRRNVPFAIIEQFRPVSRYLERDEGALGDGVVDIIRKAHNVIGDEEGEFYTVHDYGRASIEALRYGHCDLALDLAKKKSVFNELLVEIIRRPDYLTPPLTCDELKRKMGEVTPYFVPHAAAAAGRIDVLEWYGALHAASNALTLKDEEGWTPIHYAAAAECTTALKWIIPKGGTHQVTFRNSKQKTPLHVAVETGRIENVKNLITAIESLDKLSLNPDREFLLRNSSLNWRTAEGMSALHLAARRGNDDIVLALSTRPYIDHNIKGAGGVTPMMIAAATGHLSCMKLIMQCCPSAVDDVGRDALTHAAINGQTHVVGYLLKMTTMRHDSADHFGNTPLHYVCAYGWLPIVKLYAHADSSVLELKNKDGLTPAVCAFRNGHFAILSWLQRSGLGQYFGEDPDITHQSMVESIAEWARASGANEMD